MGAGGAAPRGCFGNRGPVCGDEIVGGETPLPLEPARTSVSAMGNTLLNDVYELMP